MKERLIGMALALLLCLAPSIAAQAQQGGGASKSGAERYPTKPLRLVVGLAPGGATDIVARLVAQKLTDALGQSVVVDNRSGAAGSIGAAIVAKAEPDGYTLLAVSSSFAINPSLYDLPFDSVKDFTPVIQIGEAPFLLVVNSSLPVQSVKDLIALAKAKPGTLNFSSGGHGGSGHMAGELFKHMAGIQVEHVPYRGGSPAATAVISGQVQFTFSSIVAGLRYWRAGRLRALGVTSVKRSNAAPDLPTIAEAGLPGYRVLTWYGVLAPAGTPKAIVTKLNGEIDRIIHMPEIVQRFGAGGAEPVGGAPADFGRHLADEINRFGKLVKDVGIRREKDSSR